jgi:hypothetical protein
LQRDSFRDWIKAVNAKLPAPGPPEGEIFPTLTTAQVARIAPLARERSFEVGEILWEQAK